MINLCKMAHWSLLSQQTQSFTIPSRISIPHMQGMWLGTRNLLPHYMWMWGHLLHQILSLPGVPFTPGPYSYHQAAYQLPWWPKNQHSWNSTPWVEKLNSYYPLGGTDLGYVSKLLHPSSPHQRRKCVRLIHSTRRKSWIKRNKETDQTRRI